MYADSPASPQAPTDRAGRFTEYIVDGFLAIRLRHSTLFRDMTRQIRASQTLSLKYHYVGTWMTEYWVEVCNDPDYGHEAIMKLVANDTLNMIKKAGPTSKALNVVSLGTGNGKIDVILLETLRYLFEVHFYHLIDISIDLLQLAVDVLVTYQLHKRKTTLAELRLKAIVGDFEDNLDDLKPFIDRSNPVLFTLLGYTLGNSDEEKTMLALHRAMGPSDLLLVDARLHEGGPSVQAGSLTPAQKEAMERPYSSTAVKRFAFGPVEVASKFQCNPDRFNFERSIRVGAEGPVPASINLFISCSGLCEDDAFRRWFLDDMDQGLARNMGHDALKLARVTYYDDASLAAWFEAKGFTIADRATRNDTGMFLLKKAET
jgi:hypothetical protein